jgi:hypothetical protein
MSDNPPGLPPEQVGAARTGPFLEPGKRGIASTTAPGIFHAFRMTAKYHG